jgi:hypothetical protein
MRNFHGFTGTASYTYSREIGQESGAAGGSFPQGLGNRNIQLIGKITF